MSLPQKTPMGREIMTPDGKAMFCGILPNRKMIRALHKDGTIKFHLRKKCEEHNGI